MTRKEYLKKKLLEHLIGPTGSILFHILIIYLAVHFIVFDTRESTQEVEVQLVEMETVDLEDILEEIEPELEPLEFEMDLEMPDMDVEMENPEVEDFTQEAPDMDFAALDVMQIDSPLTMVGLFSGRSSEGRAASLRRYGGRHGAATEAAVLRALEWLRINQNEDGSWNHGARAPAAMTGLGLLTFLAHGETVSSERYGNTVRRALQFLQSQQKEDGNFEGTGNHHVYGHGIATYAISEAYAMTRIPSLREVMDKAIQVMIDGQQPRGGWDYEFAQGTRRDTSVSAFKIQAMKAASLAGSQARGLSRSMELAIEDLRTAYRPDLGSFGYTNPGGQNEAMTAIGVLLFQLTGNAREPEVRAGTELVRTRASMNWDDSGPWALYRWYYITQVMFQTGGGVWNAWNNQFAPAFVSNQNQDGSWTSPSGRLEAGTSGREVNYGPVYSTTFAALSLQVYYRILPTFAVVESPEEEEEDTSDDVVIQII
jgi:hypothetical protein